MNSIIEAQQEFSEQLGEITLNHMLNGFCLPKFTTEIVEFEQFVEHHREDYQTAKREELRITDPAEARKRDEITQKIGGPVSLTYSEREYYDCKYFKFK